MAVGSIDGISSGPTTGEAAGGEQQDAQRFERHHGRATGEPVAGVAAEPGEADRRGDEQRVRDERQDLFDGDRETLESVASAHALERVRQHAPAHPGERPQGSEHD